MRWETAPRQRKTGRLIPSHFAALPHLLQLGESLFEFLQEMIPTAWNRVFTPFFPLVQCRGRRTLPGWDGASPPEGGPQNTFPRPGSAPPSPTEGVAGAAGSRAEPPGPRLALAADKRLPAGGTAEESAERVPPLGDPALGQPGFPVSSGRRQTPFQGHQGQFRSWVAEPLP